MIKAGRCLAVLLFSILISILLYYYFVLRLPSIPVDEIPIIDIEVGDHAYDVMQRSSYNFSFLDRQGIPPEYKRIYTGTYAKRDGRFLIRLRNGKESATIPWYPVDASIAMTNDTMEELTATFYNFPQNKKGSSSYTEDSTMIGDHAAEREAFIDLFFLIESLNVKPIEPPSCYRNSLNIDKSPCNGDFKAIPVKNWTRESLRAEIDKYIQAMSALYAQDSYEKLDTLRGLTLGQWFMDNGGLVHLRISDQFMIEHKDRHSAKIKDLDFSFVARLTINNYYLHNKGIYASLCFNSNPNRPISPLSSINYSPEQAKIIYGGLYEEMGPLLYEGSPVDDMFLSLYMMSDGIGFETHESWSSEGKALPDYCHLLPELEKQAGYVAERDDRH